MEKNSLVSEKEFLGFLKSLPGRFTASEIRIRISARHRNVPQYEVLEFLRNLKQKGLVRHDRGRWELIGEMPTQRAATIEIPDIVPAWTPGTSPILTGTVGTMLEPLPIRPVKQPLYPVHGPWSTMRKLLYYYIDCLRNDDACQASANERDINSTCFFLAVAGRWYPECGRPWQYKIPKFRLPADFVKRLASLGDDACVVLGYATQIWTKTDNDKGDSFFLRPLFTYQLDVHVESTEVVFYSDEPWPEANMDWLDYAISKPEEKRAFLAECGLISRGRSDEGSKEDFVISANTPNLQQLANAASVFFSKKITEPLRPECISAYFNPSSLKNGIYNRAVLMLAKRPRYTSNLIKELRDIAGRPDDELNQTSLKFIFQKKQQDDEDSEKQDALPEAVVLDQFPLNSEQRHAVSQLLQKSLSVITGPPGTGKSQVVAAGMMNARLKQMTALFASRNHKAISAVVDRLNNSEQEVIVRVNSKDDPSLKFGFTEAIKKILSLEHNEDYLPKWQNKKELLAYLLTERGRLAAQADIIEGLRDNLGMLEEQIAYLSHQWNEKEITDLEKCGVAFPSKAIERLNKIFEPYLKVRGDQGLLVFLSLLFLRGKIRNLVVNMKTNYPHWAIKDPGLRVERARDFICYLSRISKAKDYIEKKKMAQGVAEELKKQPLFDDLVAKIQETSSKIEKQVAELLELDLKWRQGLAPGSNREDLADIRALLSGRSQTLADDDEIVEIEREFISKSSRILNHYPLWAVTNLSIKGRIPLVPGLFDLAILDEASQCDIPSAIPILFRAKRVTVVGDPHQLAHVSNLSLSKDTQLQKRHDLTLKNRELRYIFSAVSLYDLVAQTNDVNPVLLRETYRSCAEIADYSNDNFYAGKLRVATVTERLNVPNYLKPGIHWTDTVSDIKTSGVSGCYSEKEVDQVCEIIKTLQTQNFEGTVGVVTPFVQQKQRLYDRITEEIPFDVRDRMHLVIETANGFQGDERDVMVMSLCCGNSMPQGALYYVKSTANMMNVAVSRARAVLHVVGDRQWAKACGVRHLSSLALERKQSPPREKSPWHPHESPWEKALFDALKRKGISPEPQYAVMGRRLDLALLNKAGRCRGLDIEVDGDTFHRNLDGTRKRDDIWRDIQLKAAGWKVTRFWVYQLREDMDQCVRKILTTWDDING